MRFGVTIPTYYRKKFQTRPHLERALRSILAQTYQDWKVYLIGDRYENNEEFEEICKLIPSDKLYSINLPVAKERDAGICGNALWNCGGVNAVNTAIDQQRKDGIEITSHLDDDDYWGTDHLQTLADAYRDFPEAVFIYTCAYFKKTNHIPRRHVAKVEYDNLIPTPYDVVHATVSWRLDKIPFNYNARQDVPTDAAMWSTIANYCVSNNLKTLYVPKVTAFNEQERMGDL